VYEAPWTTFPPNLLIDIAHYLKEGANQQVYFAGLRYSPNAHFWSELGVQTARRGDRTGTYPLASMVYKF
jgi:hypothetical protein